MPENEALDGETILAATEELLRCDGYLVIVVYPQTAHVEAHGPYDGLAATATADRMRGELDRGGLYDSAVGVVRLHHS